MCHEFFNILAAEDSNRLLNSLGVIFQIVGLIIPACIAIIVYVINSRQQTVDGVVEYFKDWGSNEVNSYRLEAVKILKQFNNNEISFQEIVGNSDKRKAIVSFLNELEFMAIFIQSGGKLSYRKKVAKRYFRKMVIDYWKDCEVFVGIWRTQSDHPRFLLELETLANDWS